MPWPYATSNPSAEAVHPASDGARPKVHSGSISDEHAGIGEERAPAFAVANGCQPDRLTVGEVLDGAATQPNTADARCGLTMHACLETRETFRRTWGP